MKFDTGKTEVATNTRGYIPEREETERQRDRKTERHKDRETETQRDTKRETERHKDTKRVVVLVLLPQFSGFVGGRLHCVHERGTQSAQL